MTTSFFLFCSKGLVFFDPGCVFLALSLTFKEEKDLCTSLCYSFTQYMSTPRFVTSLATVLH